MPKEGTKAWWKELAEAEQAARTQLESTIAERNGRIGQLEEALELADSDRIALQERVAELEEAAKPIEVPALCVRFTNSGVIPGVGVVSTNTVMSAPPAVALERIPHVRITPEQYGRAPEHKKAIWHLPSHTEVGG